MLMDMLLCLCGRKFNASALDRCPACKMPASQVRLITPEQREARKLAERKARQEVEEMARLTAEERERLLQERRDAYIEDAIERMEATLAEGRIPALHTTVLMRSQYGLDGQTGGSPPDVTAWTALGMDGWEVVASFPHTTGIALRNEIGSDVIYGGGIGGMVDGVYLILRFPVTAEVLEQSRSKVEDILGQLYEREGEDADEIVVPYVPRGKGPAQSRASAGGTVAAAATGGFIGYGFTVSRPMESGEDGGGAGGDEGGDFGGFDF